VINNHQTAADMRGTGHIVSAADLSSYGAGYTFDFSFTIADIHNHADTRLYVSV